MTMSKDQANRTDISKNGSYELIDSGELAARLRVPVSWIRDHTRERTPKQERLPCVRFGRYVRFEWGSPWLTEWVAKRRCDIR